MTTQSNNELLVGASKIAAELGVNRAKIYNLINTGKIPVFHLGNLVAIRKTKLNEWLVSLENEAAAA